MLHHGAGLHGGPDPHLHQPHQPGRTPAARQDEEANANKSRHGGQPPAPAGGTGQVGCPVAGARFPFSEAAQSPESQALPKRPPLTKITEVTIVHSSLLTASLVPSPQPGPDLQVLAQASPKCQLSGPHEPSGRTVYPIQVTGTTPTRPSYSTPLMTHLLASDPQRKGLD